MGRTCSHSTLGEPLGVCLVGMGRHTCGSGCCVCSECPGSSGPQLMDLGAPLSCPPFSCFLGCSVTCWRKATLHPEPTACVKGIFTSVAALCRILTFTYIHASVGVSLLSIKTEPQGSHTEPVVKLGFESSSPFLPLLE